MSSPSARPSLWPLSSRTLGRRNSSTQGQGSWSLSCSGSGTCQVLSRFALCSLDSQFCRMTSIPCRTPGLRPLCRASCSEAKAPHIRQYPISHRHHPAWGNSLFWTCLADPKDINNRCIRAMFPHSILLGCAHFLPAGCLRKCPCPGQSGLSFVFPGVPPLELPRSFGPL